MFLDLFLIFEPAVICPESDRTNEDLGSPRLLCNKFDTPLADQVGGQWRELRPRRDPQPVAFIQPADVVLGKQGLRRFVAFKERSCGV